MWVVKKVQVLRVLRPFLRLLSAYHWDNFRGKNWRGILCSVLLIFPITVVVLWLPLVISLNVWHLIEVGANFESIAVSFPLSASLVQMEITCIVLMQKSRTLSDTINRLQELVDSRKFYLSLRVVLTSSYTQGLS